jgi:hypothetical protein
MIAVTSFIFAPYACADSEKLKAAFVPLTGTIKPGWLSLGSAPFWPLDAPFWGKLLGLNPPLNRLNLAS